MIGGLSFEALQSGLTASDKAVAADLHLAAWRDYRTSRGRSGFTPRDFASAQAEAKKFRRWAKQLARFRNSRSDPAAASEAAICPVRRYFFAGCSVS